MSSLYNIYLFYLNSTVVDENGWLLESLRIAPYSVNYLKVDE